MGTAELRLDWQDGAAYERFMGKWSRLVGRLFVEWLQVAPQRRWLDVGCGTGAFTEVILAVCDPALVVAFDPSERHVAYARSQICDQRVELRVGDATSIDCNDDQFDVATAALVLNFIPDRARAVAQMARVVRPDGLVAAYVWDFGGRRNVSQHLGDALSVAAPDREMAARTLLQANSTRAEALAHLFRSVGLTRIITKSLNTVATFGNFEDYWDSNTGFDSPLGKACRALPPERLQALQTELRRALPTDDKGRIAFAISALAVQGMVPKNQFR